MREVLVPRGRSGFTSSGLSLLAATVINELETLSQTRAKYGHLWFLTAIPPFQVGLCFLPTVQSPWKAERCSLITLWPSPSHTLCQNWEKWFQNFRACLQGGRRSEPWSIDPREVTLGDRWICSAVTMTGESRWGHWCSRTREERTGSREPEDAWRSSVHVRGPC